MDDLGAFFNAAQVVKMDELGAFFQAFLGQAAQVVKS